MSSPAPWSTLFTLDLELGRCVGIALPDHPEAAVDPARALLHPDEWRDADAFGPVRRATRIGGRLALRAALSDIGADTGAPLLADDRGAPVAPAGCVASVSHKRSVAVALAARSSDPIGVDVEILDRPRPQIAPRVLTERELRDWERLPEPERWPALLLRFSAKEALYKALDPHVRRYVGFHEVEVDATDDGALSAKLLFVPKDRPLLARGHWRRHGDLILTSFSVERAAR